MTQLQSDIETRIAETDPDIEVLLVEQAGSTLRVFIDHPAGVSVAHCERVSRTLNDLRDDYTIEVSLSTSPASSGGARASASHRAART
jgi:ribosome maturation factor RimP